MLDMTCPKCNNVEGNTKIFVGELKEPPSTWYEDNKKYINLYLIPRENNRFNGRGCNVSCPTEEHFHLDCLVCNYNWIARFWNDKTLIGDQPR